MVDKGQGCYQISDTDHIDSTIKTYLVQIVLEIERADLAYSNPHYCLTVSTRMCEAAIMRITCDDPSHYSEIIL